MKSLNEDDMTLPGALRLALPLIATSFVFCVIGAIDMTVAGWQSPAAQAAVGIADQCIFATMLLGTGLAAATGCFVCQSLGANDTVQAHRYAIDGIVCGMAVGTMSSIACFTGCHQLIQLSGCTEATRQVATPYLQICAFGNLPFTIVIVQASILRSMGQTAHCLRLWSLIGVISIAGGLALFYSSGTIFSGSLTSLAVAWDLGALAGVMHAARILRSSFLNRTDDGQVNISRNNFETPERKLLKRVFDKTTIARLKNLCEVGIPILLSEACYLLSLAAVYAVLGQLPGSERLQAAYTVALKVEETFAVLPLIALSTVSATLVGHQLGAERFARAKVLGWQLAVAAGAVMVLCGNFVHNASPALGAIFTCDPIVLKEVTTGMASINISLPLIAFSSILFANLEGAGQTRLSLLAQFTGYILFRIPLAYVLAITFKLGYEGVWMAIVTSRFVIGLAALILYKTKFSNYMTVRLFESKRMPNSAK